MMEKQNRTIEKTAAGDARALDDIVDFAADQFTQVHKTDPHRRTHASLAGKAIDPPACR